MARLPRLESFDAPLPEPEPVDPGPSPDWFAGHAAGLTEGAAEAEARQSALRDSVVQSLADIEFQFAEARSHLLGALRPLFEALSEVVLPSVLQEGFAAELARALAEVAERDMARPMLLSLHPHDVSSVTAAVSALRLQVLRIVADKGLLPGQAVLSSGASETMIDAEAVLTAVRGALAALSDEPLRRNDNG